jgi:uncharacterized protein YeaC (DUF1315 family)
MSVSNALPIELYESLLAKLVNVLELTQKPEGVVTPQSKQAVLQAVRLVVLVHLVNNSLKSTQTNDYKNSIARAKEIATNLPGGQFLMEDQDEVIRMLNVLRDRKRYVHLLIR